MSKLNWTKNKRNQTTRISMHEERLRRAHREEVAAAQVAKRKAPMASTQDIDDLRPPERPLVTKATLESATMLITPTQAARWLEGNTHNRPLRQRDVEIYATDMEVGRWKLNGESVIFDNTNKLLDGQHRLWACVESNTPFESVVVFGADPEAFTTIDQGRHRSAGDHLYVAGIQAAYRAQVAATASLVLKYRNGQLFSSQRVPADSILTLCKQVPEVVWWANEACRNKSLKVFTTPIAATLFLGSKNMKDKALKFMEQWRTGIDLQSGSPVLALRQRVLSGNLPFRAYDRFYLVVSAWNAFAKERPIMKVQSMRGDKFPRIEGEE